MRQAAKWQGHPVRSDGTHRPFVKTIARMDRTSSSHIGCAAHAVVELRTAPWIEQAMAQPSFPFKPVLGHDPGTKTGKLEGEQTRISKIDEDLKYGWFVD
ncbi:hypothetical protein BSY18_4142 (plasmid) [Blastomonas sp. RAC04]|nr:hypothetical protein BSY18_4142 [Blastomonas sp. RAC04]